MSASRFLLFLTTRVMKSTIHKRTKRPRNHMYGSVGRSQYAIVLKEEKTKYVGARMAIVAEATSGDGERIILTSKIVEAMLGFCESRYVG